MTEPRSEKGGLDGPDASTMTPTTLTLLVGRIVAALLAWSGTVIIVRSLSTRDWGAYSFVFSVLGIIGLLTDLQVSRVVIRELMADPDGAGPVLSSFCLFRIAFGFLGYAVAVGVVAAAHYPPDVVLTTVVVGPVLIVGALGGALVIGFSSRLWLRPTAVAAVLGQAVQLGAIIAVALFWHHGLVYFAVPSIAGIVVMCGYQLVVLRRVYPAAPADRLQSLGPVATRGDALDPGCHPRDRLLPDRHGDPLQVEGSGRRRVLRRRLQVL